jgi:DNA polymerase-1
LSLDDVTGVTLVDSVDDAFAMMRWLSTKTEIALDIEGSGLKKYELSNCTHGAGKYKEKVRLVQFGDQREAWCVPFEQWGGVVHDVARKFEGTYVTHNGPNYDIPMLRNAGVEIPTHKVHDTRLMAHVVDSTGSLALKNLCKRLVDPRAASMQQELDDAMKKSGWGWDTVPITFQPYWLYGGVDTILTLQLKDILWPQVQSQAPDAYALELAVVWVTERMERKGILVDREHTARFRDELTEYMVSVEAWCENQFNVYPGANAKVIKRLQDDGVVFTQLTKGGNISLDKTVLESISHPLAQAVLGRRRAQKVCSTYLGTYLNLTEFDPRIHPSINTVGGSGKNPFEPGGSSGVRTGRMSSNDPNMQNVPTRGVFKKKIRNCFVVPEGYTWIKCDADQIEMRGMAHMTQDSAMIAAFNAEGDFFVNLARQLFNEPEFVKADPRRQFVKNGCYGKVYGAGIPKFSATAGVSEDEGRAFMNLFDATFNGVVRWTRELEALARRRLDVEGEAYVRSPLTNRRLVADSGKLYTLVNYAVQGMAAELLKIKIVEADNAGLGDFLLLPVHDELDLEVPDDQVDDVTATLLDVVNDNKLLSVPLTWSADFGKRWGDCG